MVLFALVGDRFDAPRWVPITQDHVKHIVGGEIEESNESPPEYSPMAKALGMAINNDRLLT